MRQPLEQSTRAAAENRFDHLNERATVTTMGDPQYRPWLDVAPPNEYLQNIASSATGKSYKARAKSLLKIEDGTVVADLGCGAGVDLPGYAEAAGRTGQVIGIDNDHALLHHARKNTNHLPTVSITHADIHDLPLESGSVDRIHIDRVLQHVTTPSTVLTEAARALNRTGRIVCIEPDWATLTFDHADATFSRTYTQHVVDQVIRNATIGGALPQMLSKAGFNVKETVPFTAQWSDAVEADKILGFRDVCEHAIADGLLPAAQTQNWINDLMTGPFFASLSLFVVAADINTA